MTCSLAGYLQPEQPPVTLECLHAFQIQTPSPAVPGTQHKENVTGVKTPPQFLDARSREAGGQFGFEVLLPPAAGLFLTGMKWFSILGLTFSVAWLLSGSRVTAMRQSVLIEADPRDVLPSIPTSQEYLCVSTVITDSLGPRVQLGVERRQLAKRRVMTSSKR